MELSSHQPPARHWTFAVIGCIFCGRFIKANWLGRHLKARCQIAWHGTSARQRQRLAAVDVRPQEETYA